MRHKSVVVLLRVEDIGKPVAALLHPAEAAMPEQFEKRQRQSQRADGAGGEQAKAGDGCGKVGGVTDFQRARHDQ